MSAEVLRRAAALMRERAEAATPGPWTQHTAEAAADTAIFAGREWVTNIDNCERVGQHMRTPGGSICSDQALPNGEHIASWHPDVALGVADLLDAAAVISKWEQSVGRGPVADVVRRAVIGARTYLGELS